VEVYNAASALVSSSQDLESHTIGRSQLPAGVYIVRINNFVTKVSL
ncbi:MAG: T9SS type A sorting domain-containing protein, partial [Muribaculaceae bacterium]|nr:T9SS type A sorting domain-containing protein [Muribaculaceae bacterium]